MMKNLISNWILFQFIAISSFAQSTIQGTVKGLATGDTAVVMIQKSNESFFYKKIGGKSPSADINFVFANIPNGKWALSIDSKGYLFPTAKVIEVNNAISDNIITLTKAPADSNFRYQWEDDSSYVGHAQQTYINDKVEIEILGKLEKIPDNFNSINILNQYGFLLSDTETPWTSEESYRLYQTLKKFNFPKYSEGDSVKVKSIWTITDKYIDKDITFTSSNGITYINISRAAFTYASPLVVTVDGVKGKYFSKRLFNALAFYYTDKGINTSLIDEMAKTRYGFEFLQPSAFLKSLMNETETNFQAFTSEEKLIILAMFEEFPEAMQRQDQLKYMVRRINGQKHPVYPDAPAIAWVMNQNIEWMESAFKEQTIETMHRLVLHEKSHFLWQHSFDASIKDEWTKLGGWFLDPTSLSGWSTSNTTEFVSAYAHLKNPNEDMAESIAFYITNPEALRSRSLKKFEFIRDRIMKGTRYISVIRPDLTFTVYNLFPDYNYPGKIKRTKLEVFGKENEDKRIVFEIELTIMNKAFDGAQYAQCRFVSPIGTIKDMWLYKANTEGSILRGEITLSKFAKSGYWIIPQVVVWDAVGNQRLENNSTYGVKCFVNNPLEDVTPPLYVQGSLKMDSTSQKFTDFAGDPNVNGTEMQAMRIRFSMIEKNTINPNGRVLARVFMPTLDSTDKYNISPYSKDVQRSGSGILNDYPDSLKSCDFYFPIPEYFPSGYYSISFLEMQDVALNVRRVLLDKDTANKNYFIKPNYVQQRALRDSIYFKTKYPDYKPPVLDLNDIRIQATPTNPVAPNGETLFEMWLWIKDESDYPGKASGFSDGNFTLRDPQGLEHVFGYSIFDVNYFYAISPDSSIYGYKLYYTKVLLPAGSPPGLWGVSSINLFDKARNRKFYNFVELVRFDVEESKVLQVTPYVEILGKKVNMYNADSATVNIGCKSCKNQNYRLRMYSSMGGNSAVFEGKMTADTIQLKNLKITGVNDGVLYATVFMLDSTKALIGTGKSIYTKDTKAPTSQQLKTNLGNFGKSNLDSLIVQIQSNELNGSYDAVLMQTSIVSNSNGPTTQSDLATFSTNAVGDSILLSGSYTDGNFSFNMKELKNMADGVITLKFYLKDSMDNKATPIIKQIYKDTKDPVLQINQSSTTDLTSTITIRTNESIMNSLDSAAIILKNGNFKSISKIDSKTFRLIVDRTCNDTLYIDVKAGSIIDTVGNRNVLTNLSSVESILPKSPGVKDTSTCQNSVITLTATVLGGHTLKWYSTANGGTGSASLTPSTSTAGNTNYYVSQLNSLGCESKRTFLILTVNPKPNPPVVTNPSTCVGSTPVTLTATPISGNTLRWYGTAATGGTASNTPPVTTSNTVGITNYYVSQINSLTCESDRSVITYTVNALPIKPVIQWNGSELNVTQSYASYQWLLNNSPINAGTSVQYKPINPGLYKAIVSNAAGCLDTSAVFELLVTGIWRPTFTDGSIKLYPNPSSSSTLLDLGQQPILPLTIKLLRVDGQVLQSWEHKERVLSIPLAHLTGGVYWVSIQKGKELIVLKLIKK